MSLTPEQRGDVERLADTAVDVDTAVEQLRETYGELGAFEAARVFDARRDSARVTEVRPL